MSECEEIARALRAQLPGWTRYTMEEARPVVQRALPGEGVVVVDNVAWALARLTGWRP